MSRFILILMFIVCCSIQSVFAFNGCSSVGIRLFKTDNLPFDQGFFVYAVTNSMASHGININPNSKQPAIVFYSHIEYDNIHNLYYGYVRYDYGNKEKDGLFGIEQFEDVAIYEIRGGNLLKYDITQIVDHFVSDYSKLQ